LDTFSGLVALGLRVMLGTGCDLWHLSPQFSLTLDPGEVLSKKHSRLWDSNSYYVRHLNAMRVAKGKVRGDGGITGCPDAASPAANPSAKNHVEAGLKK